MTRLRASLTYWFSFGLLGLVWMAACGQSNLPAGDLDPNPIRVLSPVAVTPSYSARTPETPQPAQSTPGPDAQTQPPNGRPETSDGATTATIDSPPFPTAGPLPGTPFGRDFRFVLHRVQPGETFGSVADLYGAQTDAVRSANPVPFGLQAGQLIVIPQGALDEGNVPPLQVVYLTETASIQALAQRYHTDPGTIEAYNDLGNLRQIPVGRWLVVPWVP